MVKLEKNERRAIYRVIIWPAMLHGAGTKVIAQENKCAEITMFRWMTEVTRMGTYRISQSRSVKQENVRSRFRM